MGLFDKKYCDICGEKVNMLTQKKAMGPVRKRSVSASSSIKFLYGWEPISRFGCW